MAPQSRGQHAEEERKTARGGGLFSPRVERRKTTAEVGRKVPRLGSSLSCPHDLAALAPTNPGAGSSELLQNHGYKIMGKPRVRGRANIERGRGAPSSPPQNMGARRQVTGSAWSGNPLSAARKIFLPTKYSYPQSEGFLAGKSGPAPPATGRKGWSPGKTSTPSPGIWGRKILLVGRFFGGNLLGRGGFSCGRRRRRRPGIFRPGSQNIAG